MARVTVEDCLQNVKNRFELVIIAAKRARMLMRGSVDAKVPWDNDKATVVALREIAAGYTNFEEPAESREMSIVEPTTHAETAAPTITTGHSEDTDSTVAKGE